MSLASETVNNPAIDNLIQSSNDDGYYTLKWIFYEEITANVKPTQIDNVYFSSWCQRGPAMLVLLGSNEECTPTLVSEFARIYSLPINKYNNYDNNFRRYSQWLYRRSRRIHGFTKSDDGNYYMVADRKLYHCYSLYGFCSTCGILRCSSVWCICGHKQLSDGWTSKNHKLDDFIKKSQLQTNSPNDAYLEWIPDDWYILFGLPIFGRVQRIPLEITDETNDLYYAELCDKHPDLLKTDVWVTIGFTYDNRKYCLVRRPNNDGAKLCLACTASLVPKINAFCYKCKAPTPLGWTTGNKSLDLFLMESWRNTMNEDDAYIQWIEYSTLMNVREMTSLRHGCTHIAEWNELTCVTLKKIADKHLSDFYQLAKEYPTILTPDNIWIIGITRELSTREYYLVFYYDVYAILDSFIRNNVRVEFMQYSDFYELNEIGSGGYGTVYTAKYKKYLEVWRMRQIQTVALKRFKNFDEMPELFISEFRNHAKCATDNNSSLFIRIYGVVQDPETKEYMTVMQYANGGSLLSYLVQNKLTWLDKLLYLRMIAWRLHIIHEHAGLVHCNLHGGNIVSRIVDNNARGIQLLICGLGLSQSVNSRKSNPTSRNVLPFIAPEVFHTRKFTQKSDIYSFGIIMYLMATGETPFRDWSFDECLAIRVYEGLRPSMPDSAPEEYKKLAEQCCDADPDERPSAWNLLGIFRKLIEGAQKDESGDNVWNTVYHDDVKLLSHHEENKYSSTLLSTGALPKPRNSNNLNSATATQTNS